VRAGVLAESRTGALGLQGLPGIGPARAAKLRQAGMVEPIDLVRRFPTRYRLLPGPTDIADLTPGEVATLVGSVVRRRRLRPQRRGVGHLQALLEDETGSRAVVFYGQGYLSEKLAPGVRMRVTGRLGAGKPALFQATDWEILGPDESGEGARIRPVHAPVPGVPEASLRKAVDAWLSDHGSALDDPLSARLREKHGFPGLLESVRALHAPPSSEALSAALRRMLYQSMLGRILMTGGRGIRRDAAIPVCLGGSARSDLVSAAPFALTRDQESALEEVLRDMNSRRAMRRMLQGDVGSGKSAVAILACLAAARAGLQAVVLAPTEPLARQLHGVLSAWGGEEVALITASQPPSRVKDLKHRLRVGRLRLAVGTHALLSDDVILPRLALVVVDEQHRFGVLQRLKLVRKAEQPHLLCMSATPIPRSLALALHADLDHSILAERPAGAPRVSTVHHDLVEDGPFPWGTLACRVRAGAKAFVVFPALESGGERMPSLLEEGRAIVRRHFKGLPVAALHGRLEERERSRILDEFRNGVVRVLFCTTVIEVGIDVPDASEIAVVGADRFGLSQLHQLRGRVGRDGRCATCWLITSRAKERARRRLGHLVRCNDGFALAERDLEERGPGDMMGVRQHGARSFLATEEDRVLFTAAVEDGRELIRRGLGGPDLAERLLFWSPKRFGPRSATLEQQLDAG